MSQGLIGRVDRAAATLQYLLKEAGRLPSGFFSPVIPEPHVAGILHQILHDPFPEEVGDGHPIDLGLSKLWRMTIAQRDRDNKNVLIFSAFGSSSPTEGPSFDEIFQMYFQ